ncbi:PGPGW domain-containing protein [Actinomadura miaoliensis]|uniref:TIGR02611 family protein n=1 Tax=Actinomadura miaoliensis TaxID=430685 RepID=A0ABP7VAD7_9ACTN
MTATHTRHHADPAANPADSGAGNAEGGGEVASAPRTGRAMGWRLLRKVAVAIAGVALIAAGVAMLVLPGPGVVAILAGLGLLGTEFPAARRVSERINGYIRTAWRKIRRRPEARPDAGPDA